MNNDYGSRLHQMSQSARDEAEATSIEREAAVDRFVEDSRSAQHVITVRLPLAFSQGGIAMTDGKHFSWYVERAEHFKAIDQTRIHLYSYPEALDTQPWELVTEVSDGCAFMGDLPTGAAFAAQHPSGLEFRWSLDLLIREERSQAGLDKQRILAILHLLPSGPRTQLMDQLKRRAEVLREMSAKNQAWTNAVIEAAVFCETADQLL